MTPHQAVLYSPPHTFGESFFCFGNYCAGAVFIQGRILHTASDDSGFRGRVWKLTAYGTRVFMIGQEYVKRAFVCVSHGHWLGWCRAREGLLLGAWDCLSLSYSDLGDVKTELKLLGCLSEAWGLLELAQTSSRAKMSWWFLGGE